MWLSVAWWHQNLKNYMWRIFVIYWSTVFFAWIFDYKLSTLIILYYCSHLMFFFFTAVQYLHVTFSLFYFIFYPWHLPYIFVDFKGIGVYFYAAQHVLLSHVTNPNMSNQVQIWLKWINIFHNLFMNICIRSIHIPHELLSCTALDWVKINCNKLSSVNRVSNPTLLSLSPNSCSQLLICRLWADERGLDGKRCEVLTECWRTVLCLPARKEK